MDPTHRVRHVEFVLEAVRDRVRISDKKEVVGHPLWIRRSESHTVTRQERRLRLSRAYPIHTSEDSEAMRKVSSHLLSPQIEQRLQGRNDRWVAASWKDDSPPRLRQVGGIDALHRTEVLDAHPFPPGLQLSDVVCVGRLILNDRPDVPELERTEQVVAGRPIDAVQDQYCFVVHACSSNDV